MIHGNGSARQARQQHLRRQQERRQQERKQTQEQIYEQERPQSQAIDLRQQLQQLQQWRESLQAQQKDNIGDGSDDGFPNGLPNIERPRSAADIRQLLNSYGGSLTAENRALLGDLATSLDSGADTDQLLGLAQRMRSSLERR